MLIQPKNKVTPFIWFNTEAEAAANFYVSLFADSTIIDVARWGKGSPYAEGSVMSVTLELAGSNTFCSTAAHTSNSTNRFRCS